MRDLLLWVPCLDSSEGLPVPITILRDTGAKQTLIRKGVVDLPSSSFTGHSTAVLGVAGGYEWLPIHRLYLRSGLVTGVVLVAEAPHLPFTTIDFMLWVMMWLELGFCLRCLNILLILLRQGS